MWKVLLLEILVIRGYIYYWHFICQQCSLGFITSPSEIIEIIFPIRNLCNGRYKCFIDANNVQSCIPDLVSLFSFFF